MAAELTLLSRVAYRGKEITSPRLRSLLALLAADLRTGCGTARLVEGLWPDVRPENPTKAVQILVSRARSQLGADVIERTPTGYRLSLAEDQVDAAAALLRVSASAQHARAGDHPAALAHAEAGLTLWDGEPRGDGALDDPVSALRVERASTYRSLVRARGLALSRLGRAGEAVELLVAVSRERPRDEEVLLELLRSEAATAGPAAALARYDGYRREIQDDLGTDPGPALQGLYQQLLQGATPAIRQGVAYEPNPLLGRDDDIAAVTGLLHASRVVSIVGPGGLGKTRLAHVVSRQAEQRVVHFVELAGVGADGDVAAEVGSVLGVGETRPGRTPNLVTTLAAALGPGPALLVLDNCEHVIGGAADLVHALVSLTKEVRVLTTSRAPLGLSSESVHPLPELSLPVTVDLFTQRARAARPDVELPAEAVTELCRRLDGLPLAVELAAARVRAMSVAEITRRLDDRFGLLRGGARDAPQRHQTLHAVVDWSWNLLEPDGQAAMRALSVFTGGFTADAAWWLLHGEKVPPTLERLVDQSLLKVTETGSGMRFRMLETVREFATARREAAGETEQIIDGLLAWARDLGREHHESLFGGDPYPSVELVRAEQDNLVQALRYALARDDTDTVAAITAVAGGLWTIEQQYSRLAALFTDTGWALSHFRPAPELVEVTRTALCVFTAFAFAMGGARAGRSLVALRRLPPVAPTTVTRAAAIVLGSLLGDRAALEALCGSDEPLLAGAANSVASHIWETRNDRDNALKAARRMLAAFEQRDVPWLRALAHCRISELCLQVEHGEQARRHLAIALPLLDRVGARSQVAGIRWWLVLANLQAGDVDEAERWLEPIAASAPEEDIGVYGYDLGVRAEVLLARGEVEAGLRMWRRVIDGHANATDPITPGVPYELDPWVMEAQAVAVVAHARHGRLDLVDEIAEDLPGRLAAMLSQPLANPPPYLIEMAVCGTLLLAVAMTDLERGRRAGDEHTVRSGARMVALAERLGFLRYFQPTMSAAGASQAAERAGGSAYGEAVSSYAELGRDGLRAAALAALQARESARAG